MPQSETKVGLTTMDNDLNGPRKRFLALDTATASLAVAVTADGQVLHEINASGERNHSVHLLPVIGQALSAAETEGEALSGIAVGIGPGSYTGTRIAVTAAKTLAWAWNTPLYGVSTLQALAWGGHEAGLAGHASAVREAFGEEAEPEADDWIIPLLDARRGQVFTALFMRRAGEASPRRLAPDAIRLMGEWLAELGGRLQEAEADGKAPARIWFTGETGVHAAAEQIVQLPEPAELYAVPYELEGRWAARLGERMQAEGHGGDEVHSLVPNYTQLSEAEANLLKSGGGGGKQR